MSPLIRIILISIALSALGACASKKEKQQIKNEVASTPSLEGQEELHGYEKEMLSENKSLNKEQKKRLRELLERNFKDIQEIQSEIDKRKAVLFKELISESGSKSKIRILENQILKLNRKRTRYSLSAYKEAKEIVGKSEIPLEKTLNMIDNRTIHEF